MTIPAYGPEAVLYDDGTIASNAPISIVTRGGAGLIPVYSDAAGTVTLANPVVTDARGNLFFYAAAGEYDILAQGARIPISMSGGGGGSTPSYTHIQTIANATWTIIHGLGFNPQVSVIIGGAEVIADVSWPDLNTVIVTLDAARLGSAYLS